MYTNRSKGTPKSLMKAPILLESSYDEFDEFNYYYVIEQIYMNMPNQVSFWVLIYEVYLFIIK